MQQLTVRNVRHAELLEENCVIAPFAGILGERWTCLPAPPVDLLQKPNTEPIVGRGLIMHRPIR
jgi:hypothetical protein